MFQPEKLERDRYGFCFHSALNKSEEEDITRLPEAEGMEFNFVSFEADASDKLQNLYQSSADSGSRETWPDAVRAWQPSRPKGDCWFLLAIYDTDDGPYACFTRRKFAGRHRSKLVEFDEETGVGKWACKCGQEVTRTASIICEVPGAAS
jgi:hypothetical protein